MRALSSPSSPRWPHTRETSSRVCGSVMPAQQHLDAADGPDARRALFAPPLLELGQAVRHGDEHDALARAVREHRREVDRAYLRNLVHGHQQRRVKPAVSVRLPASPATKWM